MFDAEIAKFEAERQSIVDLRQRRPQSAPINYLFAGRSGGPSASATV